MNQISRYNILKRLGGGGFGEVFLGEDPAIGRQVAIKVFKPKDENLIAFATSSDEEGLEILRARFLNEAKILASLDEEPNIVGVLEYGELEDGAPFYVMPYLPNSLADELGKDVFDVSALEELPEEQHPRALPMERALAYLEQILTGLAAAHARGLIHRDIKPSNLMLSESGQLRIVDFGIAKAPDGQHSTVSHLGLGSRNYMAPEQRESAKHVDARADVYSAGVVAYRMLTGKLPTGRFSDPNVAVPALGRPMNDLLLGMLAQDKADRPKDAAKALADFQKARPGVGEEENATDTGTWVGEGEAGSRDELKPLRAKIAELVAENGQVAEADRPGLNALASIADLSAEDLDRLINDVIDQDKSLRAKQRLVQSLRREVKVRSGPLTDSQLASYDTAAEAVGWDRNKIQMLMEQAVAELRGVGSSETANRSKRTGGAGFSLPIKPIAAAVAVVLVLGAGGYGVYEWRQGQIIAEQAERERAGAVAEAEKAWRDAQAEDSIEAYSGYLAQWPDALNAEDARSRIEELETQGQSIIARVQDYLNRLGYRVPQNGELETRTSESIKSFEEAQGLVLTGSADQVLLESLVREYNRRDNEAWQQAVNEDTESAFETYRKEFPDGGYVDEADTRIAQVRDREAWQSASARNSEAAYRQYAENHPQGAYIEQVEPKIEQLRQQARARAAAEQRERDEAAWAQASNAGTISAYRQYAEDFPSGQYVTEVDQRIAAIQERDDAAWAHAEEEGDTEDFEHYLRAWPEGRHAEMAKEQIESRKELIRNTQIELMRLGRDVSENGVLDKATAMAISEFQRWTDRERTSRPNSALLEVLKATDDWPSPIPGEVFRDCPDCPEMVVIPSGSFQMGSPSSEPQRDSDEGPQHRVSVPAFALAKTEVTFAQWDACVSDGGCSHRPEDRGWGRGNRPVMNVNWNDAQEYVRWLSRKTGADYRLPSEAEWEYAARAGTTTRFNTGNCITSDQANFNGSYPPSGCSGGQHRERTVAVGSFGANAWGLYDMHGNVREWVQDCWNDSYAGAPGDGSTWMSGDCGRAVLRGGSWINGGLLLRSASRLRSARGYRNGNAGFRLARYL